MLKLSKRALIAITLALCLIMALASPVLAQLSVTGAKIEASVAPGSETTYHMSVANTSEDEAMDVAIEVKGYGTSPTASYQWLEPEDDTSPYSARELLTVIPDSFHLEPGQSQDVTVTAKIPADVGDGGRYAIIFIHTAPSGGMVATVAAVAARVLLTIDGSELITSGETSDIELVRSESGEPLEIAAIVNNNGNCHYKISAQGEIRDQDGKVVAISSPAAVGLPTIPTYSQQIRVPFLASETLPAGTYQADIEIDSDEGTLFATATGVFQLSEPWEPPSEGYGGRIISIAAGLVILGLIIFFVIRRARRGY